MMGADDSVAGDTEIGWGVGAVAARLGIAASTLRTWERRYGVGPTRRTIGGHRRYTQADIDRVRLTQQLIARGAPPSDAAQLAHSLAATALAAALDPEDDVDGRGSMSAASVVDEVIRSAHVVDAPRIGRMVGESLRTHGAIAAWTSIIAPALVRVGDEWATGTLGIEAEHLTSNAIVGELRAYTRALPRVEGRHATLILASAEEDQHALPVFALESALAEAGLPSHVLGSRCPAPALVSMVERVSPRVVFLWASMPRSDDERIWSVLAEIADYTALILGGPGWPDGVEQRLGEREAVVPPDLRSAVDRILDLVG